MPMYQIIVSRIDTVQEPYHVYQTNRKERKEKTVVYTQRRECSLYDIIRAVNGWEKPSELKEEVPEMGGHKGHPVA